jgi:hypothetical protein
MRYPFPSKSEILASINANFAYAVDCLVTLDSLQTLDEQLDKTTRYKNARGWQSSHAKKGSELAAKARAKVEMTDEERATVTHLVSKYTRQLAVRMRADMIERNPDLAAVAAKFSAA